MLRIVSAIIGHAPINSAADFLGYKSRGFLGNSLLTAYIALALVHAYEAQEKSRLFLNIGFYSFSGLPFWHERIFAGRGTSREFLLVRPQYFRPGRCGINTGCRWLKRERKYLRFSECLSGSECVGA